MTLCLRLNFSGPLFYIHRNSYVIPSRSPPGLDVQIHISARATPLNSKPVLESAQWTSLFGSLIGHQASCVHMDFLAWIPQKYSFSSLALSWHHHAQKCSEQKLGTHPWDSFPTPILSIQHIRKTFQFNLQSISHIHPFLSFLLASPHARHAVNCGRRLLTAFPGQLFCFLQSILLMGCFKTTN